MMEHAKYDVLALSDADVRVRPDYLRRTIAPLVKPTVGLTTCLYRGRGFFGLPSVIESLLINCDFVPMVLTAQYIGPAERARRVALLQAPGARRDGRLPALADYLADDNMLGEGVKRAGYAVELLPYVVETILDSTTVADVWRHQVRWARTYRVLQPIGWFSSIVTHATTWGTAALVATGRVAARDRLLPAAIAARLGTLRVIMRTLRERDTPPASVDGAAEGPRLQAAVVARLLARATTWCGAASACACSATGRWCPIDGETLPGEPASSPGARARRSMRSCSAASRFWWRSRRSCPAEERLTPLLLGVSRCPVPFKGSDDATHLVYELWDHELLERRCDRPAVQVLGDGKTIATLDADAIKTRPPAGGPPRRNGHAVGGRNIVAVRPCRPWPARCGGAAADRAHGPCARRRGAAGPART
jgi:hypothetical protein